MGAVRKRVAIPVDRDPNRTFPEKLGGAPRARARDPGPDAAAASRPERARADAQPVRADRIHAGEAAPREIAPATAAPAPRFDALLPATAVECHLRITPAAMMCSAILAGLASLARDGRIRLELELVPDAPPLDHGPWALRDKQRPQAVIEVAGGGRAVLDAHDGAEIEEPDLLAHDLYFKRSLRPAALLRRGGERLRPLGLLNEVRNDFLDRHELASELAVAGSSLARTRTLLRWLAWNGAARVGLGGRPNLARMHAAPVPSQSQRVLLMARLWDPADVPEDEVAERAAREALNQQRIDCIRALRRAFGPRFHGGLYPDPLARRIAPDLTLPSPRAGSRREFLRRVRQHAVCVTSSGLRGSIGFRLAEFVAFSRSIVTEPLPHLLPGEFAPGRNYLEFRRPDECVARVAQLFDRGDLREQMAQHNWNYYREWLRPERIALRIVALTWAAGRARG